MQQTPIELQIEKENESSKFATLVPAIMLALLFCFLAELTSAQQYQPLRYYTFDNSGAGVDLMGNGDLNFQQYGANYTVNNSGPVNNYMTLDLSGNLITGGQFDPKRECTVEFLFRPGHDFGNTKIIQRRGGAFEVGFEMPSYTHRVPKMRFQTTYKDNGGNTISDGMLIDLDGLGIKSWDYYTDGEFHHLVFKFDGNTGKKEIWIDGQTTADFQKNITPGQMDPLGQNPEIWMSYTINYRKYIGDIDEIALYDKALPSSLIYKHYLEFQQGNHFSWVDDYTGTIPPAQPTSAGIDPNEYPPGHPNVTLSAMDQMKSFPTPRYKDGHGLIPNFQWFDPARIAGFQDGVSSNTQIRHRLIQLQKELAGRWNYSILVSGNSKAHYLYNDSLSLPGASLKVANDNPQWKASAISFWAQTNPSNIGYNTTYPHISLSTLPDNYYLRNANGQFLSQWGGTGSNKFWSPAAPVNYWQIDGQTQRMYFTSLVNALTRPLDYINENAEVMLKYPSSTLQLDPACVAAKNATGLNWDEYQGWAKSRAFKAYRDEFMSLPALANTKFTEYAVDGQPTYRHNYKEARKSNSLINGQYYSTPDFYVRWPNNWRNWAGAWHGWQWIVESRFEELAVGDNLYSPFVSAGWNIDPERNVRPAQWLGLLKALGMTGAEFYYTSFFSLSAPFPKAENWVWQLATPSYAQAVSSRCEDILRNGSLLEGDVPALATQPSNKPGYSFFSGDYRKLVVVRKHNNKNLYAFSGSIQPVNNMIGSAAAEDDAMIKLDGQELRFKVRRQGSTYIYDNTNPNDPIFYQLDGWHEYEHPSRWSQDFTFEAELFDNSNSNISIKTETPANALPADFREYTSYIDFQNTSSAPQAEFNFSVREQSATYYLWIRARSSDGTSSGIDVELDNNGVSSIGCIDSTGWAWYRYDACNQQAISFLNTGRNEHTLKLIPLNDKIEIDKIVLTKDQNLVLDPAPPNCSATIASITSNGATTFCTGDSVTLTASPGASYMWLPTGDTTQSITVKNSGTYSVLVGLGTGCSASAPTETVTVISGVAANISTSGSTTICTGDSVTLTAGAGASYQWLPNGETSQSIVVTSAGTYSVAVTDTNGCEGTSAPVVVSTFNNNGATIAANGPTNFCAGNSVTLSAPAGASYLWSNGATSQTITVNTSGSYTADLIYGSGCSFKSNQIDVVVATPAQATVANSGPASFCNGSNVTLTSSNGNSYLWSPGGEVSQAITVSQSGVYSVQVIDSSGCPSASSPVNIVVHPDAVANISNTGSTSLCPGENVLLTANPSSSYLWSNGSTSQSVTISTSGNYDVTVTDANGCTAISPAVPVAVGTTPDSTVATSGSLNLCQGDNVTLSAAAGLSYSWSNGSTDQSIIVSSNGTYNVTVTNLDGCTAESNQRIVNILATPSGNIIANGTTNICSGSTVTLTAPIGDQYVWSSGETTSSIIVDTTGTFTVQVTNNNGCSTNTNPVEINVISASAATISANSSTTFCAGDSVRLTATSGSSYLWSNGETTQSIYVYNAGSYQATVTFGGGCNSVTTAVPVTVNTLPGASISNNGPTNFCQGGSVILTAVSGASYLWSDGSTTQSITVTNTGNYNVTVQNASGCARTSNTVPVTVTSVTSAAITSSGSTSFCLGESVILSANSGASYLWSNGATTQSVTASNSGSYSVTVDYGNGCSDVSPSVTINVLPLPNVNLLANGPTTFCDGNSVQLNATGGSSYYWYPTGSTSSNLNVTASGLYSVIATDNNGCSAVSQNLIVNVLPLPNNNVVASGPTSLCQGDQISLIASAGYSYLWNNGATTQSITTGTAGNFSVNVTHPNGCESTSTPIAVSVNPKPLPQIHAPTGSDFCAGDSILLTSNNAHSYLWSNGATTQSIWSNITSTYTVIATNIHGCTGISNPITTTQFATPTVNVSVNGPTSLCQGDSAILTASPSSSYLWYPNGQTTQTIAVQDSGSYYVVVGNSYGCSANSTPININVSPAPVATISASGATSFCDGDSVVLSAPAGGIYQWSNGATTQSISVFSTGSYVVTVNNGSSCDAVSQPTTVTVKQLPSAQIQANGPLTFCDGDNVILTASTASTYYWHPNGETTQSITVDSSGTYSVLATNNGCSKLSPQTVVNVGAAPTPVVTSSVPLVLTPGGSITLNSSSSANYTWYPGGQTSQSINVTQAGYYYVTAGSSGTCEASSDSVQVVIASSTFQAYINSQNGNLMCEGDSILIEASLGASYYWFHSGETSRSVYVTQSGTYYCIVDDPGGSGPAVATIQMTELAAPFAPSITSTYSPSNGYTLYAYEPSAISYLWSTGATTSSIIVSAPGSYSVKAFNSIGCESASKSIVINNVGLQQCVTPDMLQAIQIGLNSAELTWNPAQIADNFEVSYWKQGTTVKTHITVAGNQHSLIVNNLNPTTVYEWTVKSICQTGLKISATSDFITLAGPLPCGSTPQNLQNDSITKVSAYCLWLPTSADQFVLNYKKVSETTYATILVPGSAIDNYKLELLEKGTTYQWNITSVCSGIISLPSADRYFTTLSDPVCDGPSIIKTDFIQAEAAQVSWGINYFVDSLKVFIREKGSTSIRIITIAGNPINKQVYINNLKPETTYHVWVRSICSFGKSNISNILKLTTGSIPGYYLSGDVSDPLQLNIYPVPTFDVINYAFNAGEEGPFNVSIYDGAGKLVFDRDRDGIEGENKGTINVQALRAGAYTIMIKRSVQSSVKRFVKY